MTNSLTNEVGSLRQDDMGLQVEIVERSSVIVVTLTGPTDIAALEPLHDALQLAASERKDGRTRRFLYGPGCQDPSWLAAENLGQDGRCWSVGDGGGGAQRFLGARRTTCRRRQQCWSGDPRWEPRSRQC